MSSRKQFIVFFLLLLALHYIEGRKLRSRVKHKFQNSIQRIQENSLPQTWVEGCAFDITTLGQSCQSISQAKAIYEKFFSDFSEISKSNIEDSHKVLLNVEVLIKQIGEKLKTNTEVVAFAEVQEKDCAKEIRSLSSKKDLTNLALAHKQLNLLDVFILLEKQDVSIATMTEKIKSGLDALIELCQNFLNNYDSFLANLTNKKNTLEAMMTNQSELCPSGAFCTQDGCVLPSQPNYSGMYHIRANWAQYLCAQLNGNLEASLTSRARCTYYKISFKRKSSDRNIYCIKSTLKESYLSAGKDPNHTVFCTKACGESEEFYVDEKVVYGGKAYKIASVLWGGQVTVDGSTLFVSENQDTESQIFTFETIKNIVDGQYYYLKSEWGRYLDMTSFYNEPDSVSARSKDSVVIEYTKDIFLVKFIPYNEYYWILSKGGGYLNFGTETQIGSQPAKQAPEKNINLDGFSFKLVDRDVGLHMIESKNLRFLSLGYDDDEILPKALSFTEDFMKTSSLNFEKSVFVDLLPESEHLLYDFSEEYSIKSSLGSFICVEGIEFGSYSRSRFACTRFQISLKRQVWNRNSYCIKSKANGKFVSVSSEAPHQLSCDKDLCGPSEEFFIAMNEEISGDKLVFITSVMWNSIVRTQDSKILTADNLNMDTSAVFRLSSRIVLKDQNMEGNYHIKTSLNSYMCASGTSLESSKADKAKCSAFKIMAKSMKYGANTYCIQSINSKKFIGIGTAGDFALTCSLDTCDAEAEVFIESSYPEIVSVTFVSSGRVVSTLANKVTSANSFQKSSPSYFTLQRFVVPVPGTYYFIRSRYGRYFYNEVLGNSDNAVYSLNLDKLKAKISTERKGFLITLEKSGEQYYLLKTANGQYIDMLSESSSSPSPIKSISTSILSRAILIKLIDQGDGFYRIQSDSGRYLHMRQITTEMGEVFSVKELNEAEDDSLCIEFLENVNFW